MGSSPHKRRKEKARQIAEVMGVEERQDPLETMQHSLDRAFAMLKYTEGRVDQLTEDEFMVDTKVAGKIPNEWVRLEADLRKQVIAFSGNMVSLGIAERRTRAAEIMAEVMAPVLRQVFDELKLTAAQRRKAPALLKQSLAQLEAGGNYD